MDLLNLFNELGNEATQTINVDKRPCNGSGTTQITINPANDLVFDSVIMFKLTLRFYD